MPAPLPPVVSSPVPAPTASSAGGKGSDGGPSAASLGAILGGVFGGLTALALFATVFVYRERIQAAVGGGHKFKDDDDEVFSIVTNDYTAELDRLRSSTSTGPTTKSAMMAHHDL